MHTLTTAWVDTTPPPAPGLKSYYLRARDYGDGYTLRALIADAEQAGDLWLAFTLLTPRDTHYVYASPETTVLIRGHHCDILELTPERSIRYGRRLIRS